MDELKEKVYEQLMQLQLLMHRVAHGRAARDPYRGQGRVLAILKMKPVISQKELSYLLNMSKQALAELMAKLEKSGYISREPSEEDKRIMTVRLTEEGVKAAEQAQDAPDPQLLDCLSDEELARFSEYLARIIDNYEQQFPGDYEQRRKMMREFMDSHGRFEHHRGHGPNRPCFDGRPQPGFADMRGFGPGFAGRRGPGHCDPGFGQERAKEDGDERDS